MSVAAEPPAGPEPTLRVEEAPSGAVFWVLSALGAAIIGFGIYGVIHDSKLTVPVSFIKWMVGGLILHDLVLAPLVILAGAGLRRFLPGRFRAPVQAALALAGVLALLSVPVIGAYGASRANPTVIYSHHYTRALIILFAILLAGAAFGVLRAARTSTADGADDEA